MKPTLSIFIVFLSACFLMTIPAAADDVWFVDTRSTQTTAEGKLAHLSVEKLESDGSSTCWTPSSVEEFFRMQEQNKPTAIIIHGNLMTRPEARVYGLAFRRQAKCIGDHRLVIWCWPAKEEFCRIRTDAQKKAKRADRQGAYLAAFLRDFRDRVPDAKVSILGFSFGAKLASNALNRLATTEAGDDTDDFQIRLVLLAAAVNRSSLSPGQEYGQALDAVDEMLVHVNQQDHTLKFYPLLYRIGGPAAIGREGVSGLSPEQRQKVKSVRVDPLIGQEHGFKYSLRGILACKQDFRHYVLFQ